jgi:hypothetical protein
VQPRRPSLDRRGVFISVKSIYAELFRQLIGELIGGKNRGSFWHFGGRPGKVYNWFLGVFFVLSCLAQIGRFGKDHLPEALGTTIGQTVVVAVLLFLFFKIIRLVKRAD